MELKHLCLLFALWLGAAGNAFYVGYGWYRKHFELSPQQAGKRLALEFEGAFQDAEIFLNGKKVGAHQGGCNGFGIDITGTPPGKPAALSELSVSGLLSQ